ncbi:MAG: pyruvate, water dikinase regulatory protein [Gammaproteobacteria bacterium]|nr:pyruvate, water dikinase regulatory protein [Gammaproteobacteria bacterium]
MVINNPKTKNHSPVRTVFFVSDRTGITAEALGNSLLTQFEGVTFNKIHLSFIDTSKKAENCVKQINEACIKDSNPALIFSTQIDEKYRDMMAKSNGVFFDFFETFISRMEDSLGSKSIHTAGKLHGLDSNQNYNSRINSVNFSLASDDGMSIKSFDRADIILIGVSRSGKTPTCLFMALQYGIKASNYPLIEQDLNTDKLPSILRPFKDKLFGLTINPVRLKKIRGERRSSSDYSSLKQCQSEVRRAEDIYHSNKIPYIDTTQISIEEITAKISNKFSLR